MALSILILLEGSYRAVSQRDKNIDDLRRRLDDRESKRQVSTRLSGHAARAEPLVRSLRSTSPISVEIRAKWAAWDAEVQADIREEPLLGPSYVERFKIGAGLAILPCLIRDASHESLWRELQTRLGRLAEFMRELDSNA